VTVAEVDEMVGCKKKVRKKKDWGEGSAIAAYLSVDAREAQPMKNWPVRASKMNSRKFRLDSHKVYALFRL
jgi:hypothetical protein